MEKILVAAIWYKDLPDAVHQVRNIDKGIVVTGFRHCDCIDVMARLSELRNVTFAPDGVGEFEEGFLTNKKRFVDRSEGFEIAKKANQIKPDSLIHESELYSENLY